MIDTDPQGSRFYFNEAKKTLYNLLIEDSSYKECVSSVRYGLDIICSNEHVFPAEIKMAKMNERELCYEKNYQT